MNRIKELREQRNLTLRDLSRKVGISFGALGNYENERREPKLDTWKKIANYFGVSVGYLQGLTSVETPYTELQNKAEVAPIIDKIKNNSEFTDEEFPIALQVIMARQIEKAPERLLAIADLIIPGEKHDINDFSNLELAEETNQLLYWVVSTVLYRNENDKKTHSSEDTIELFRKISNGLQNYMTGLPTDDYFTTKDNH